MLIDNVAKLVEIMEPYKEVDPSPASGSQIGLPETGNRTVLRTIEIRRMETDLRLDASQLLSWRYVIGDSRLSTI